MSNKNYIRAVIGNNLRAERVRARKTLDEVASYLGVSKRSCIYYETGESKADAYLLYKLSMYYKCNVSAFFVGLVSTES